MTKSPPGANASASASAKASAKANPSASANASADASASTCADADAQPGFAPVPGRARHDGWTAERQHRFIAALAATGTVTAAARTVAMSAKSAYALLGRAGPDSGFAQAWAAAVEAGYHDALAIALDQGIEGEIVPVFFGGRQVGTRRRVNDRLALAALRAAASRGDAPGLTARRNATDRLASSA